MTGRRLTNSRAGHPDPLVLADVDRGPLEGEPPVDPVDAIASLRPFGGDIGEDRLAPADPEAALAGGTYRLAMTLAGRGRRLEATLLLRQLIEARPEALEPRIALADLQEAAGDREEAVETLGGAIEVAAEPAPFLVRRGALVALLGRSREAEQDFREAVRRDASYWLAYRYLGAARLRAGAPGEAETVLREALTLAPQDPETVLYLGEALLLQGAFEDAAERFGQAVTLMPSDPRGYTMLGRLHDRLGNLDEAMAMHRKAREVSPA